MPLIEEETKAREELKEEPPNSFPYLNGKQADHYYQRKIVKKPGHVNLNDTNEALIGDQQFNFDSVRQEFEKELN